MFTLCMSRGPQPHRDSNNSNILNKPIKGGYLLRYKRGFFCKGWSEEWVVLYEDSTIAWFADKGLSRPRGWVRIGEAPELLAVGEWTRQVPRRPRIPQSCQIGQLLAIGAGKSPYNAVHWLMAQSLADLNDWVTAISNTLPPPTHMPMDKRLSLTNENHHHHHQNPQHQQQISSIDAKSNTNGLNGKNQAGEADHTVLSGVVINWGYGWGWLQMAQAPCTHDIGGLAAPNGSMYPHPADNYAITSGYEECDWSAFGDFSF